MKAAFVLSLASVAAAQSISSLVASIPSCAQAPLLKAAATTSCATTDYTCQCQTANQQKIAAAATPAIEAACSPADISKVLSISQQICAIALAASSAPASSAAPATSSAAAASSSAAPVTSAPASSAAATSSAAASSAASSAAPVSQISDGQPQVTVPAPVISQISDGQPQATAPVPPIYTGAAAKAGPVAGAVILAAAAFAL